MGKVCTLIAGTSSITVQIDDTSTLPAYLMGSANGIANFDECDPESLGTHADASVIRRSPNAATLKLWLHYNSALFQEFMLSDDLPRTGASLSLVLYGRNSCSDAPTAFRTIQKPLNWQAHYINGPDCDATGFDGH